MQKIDRLGWVAGVAIRSYGRRIGVRVSDPAALAKVNSYLPPACTVLRDQVVDRLYSFFVARNAEGARVQRLHLLYEGSLLAARSRKLDDIFEALAVSVRKYVAESARRRVFVHAGVVGWQGKAIVIPGRSYSGKTTLVAELVRAGATYYSDEYAVFDSRGRVHPYTKPLSVRLPGGSGEQIDYPPEAFGGRAGKIPLPVGCIVSCSYRAGANWRPRRLSVGAGVLELLANTVAVRNQPETTLSTLEKAVAPASIWKGTRGNAAEFARKLLTPAGLPHYLWRTAG
jgi:hypothetical protein